MKIFPLQSPQITSFWYYADLLSIVNTVDHRSSWVFNNYINLVSWNFRTIFYNGNTRSHMVEFYNCPFIEFQKIFIDSDKTVFGHKLRDFIIDSIDNGNYVLMMIDRFYIEQYRTEYNTHHFFHEVMINGYDLCENVFYISDNNSNGKYERFSCDMKSFELAFINILRKSDNEFDNHLFLIKAKECHAYGFDLEQVKTAMIQYVSSEVLIGRDKNGIFGLKSFDVAIDYLDLVEKKEDRFDVRPMHLLWDHKKCMTHRIQYMVEQGYIKEDTENIVKSFQEIEKNLLVSRNLLLKFGVTNQNKIIENLQTLLESTKLKEESVLREVISQLP